MAVNHRESTLKDLIYNYENDNIKYGSFFLNEVVSESTRKIILTSESILDKYSDILSTLKEEYNMTDEEYKKYMYNPKHFSYKLYGTTELWFLILRANNMYSVTEFNKKHCYIYSGQIKSILNAIINIEKSDIDKNSDDIQAKLNAK